MKELDDRTKALIESLYFKINAYSEGQYNMEGALDISKKDSDKIIFKDRKKAVTMIKAEIEEFSKEYSLDKNAVKDYLLKIIEEDINSDKPNKTQHIEVKKIVSIDDEER